MTRTLCSQPPTKPPLDENLYCLDGEELAFFRNHTGIQDEQKLKEHIMSIQKKAYNVRRFTSQKTW